MDHNVSHDSASGRPTIAAQHAHFDGMIFRPEITDEPQYYEETLFLVSSHGISARDQCLGAAIMRWHRELEHRAVGPRKSPRENQGSAPTPPH